MAARDTDNLVYQALKENSTNGVSTLSLRELIVETGFSMPTIRFALQRLQMAGRIVRLTQGPKTSYQLLGGDFRSQALTGKMVVGLER